MTLPILLNRNVYRCVGVPVPRCGMTAVLLTMVAFLVAAAAPPPDPIVLTEAVQGRIVDVRVGQCVIVELPENASTGYRWAVDRADPALVDAAEGSASYPAGLPGAGGRAQWRFTALAPGTTAVVLKKWRPWEGEAGVVARMRFGLRIGG